MISIEVDNPLFETGEILEHIPDGKQVKVRLIDVSVTLIVKDNEVSLPKVEYVYTCDIVRPYGEYTPLGTDNTIRAEERVLRRLKSIPSHATPKAAIDFNGAKYVG